MKVGDVFTQIDGPMTREGIKAYAKASGDNNPIHVDEDFATNRGGLNGVIAHGMFFYGFAIRMINNIALKNNAKIASIGCDFRGMVRPGDWVITKATVKSIEGKKVTFDIVQVSKMPLKLEKDGKLVKEFEGQTRKWLKGVKDGKVPDGSIKTEQTPEGILTFQEFLSIPAKAVLELP